MFSLFALSLVLWMSESKLCIRKVVSSVRVYAEAESLAFFLHQKQMALKFFAAQTRAREFGVTADVMLRSSQASAGYYEIVQNSLADLVSPLLPVLVFLRTA